MAHRESVAFDDIPGSWSFSIRTQKGRVIVCVPNRVLASCFGSRKPDELFRTFTSQIELLRKAALVHLLGQYQPVVELAEKDISDALKMH